MKKLFIVAVLSAALFSGGCASLNTDALTSGVSKFAQAAMITDAEVSQYVGEYIKQLDAENTIATGNDPYNVRLERIAGAINNRDGINIKVYKTSDVNAFAVADGSIRVYSGLMDIMSDEEVLGVIGHEIGHVKLNHTRKAFQDALKNSAYVDIISSAGGVAENLPGSFWDNLGQTYLSSRFSQKQEYEADDYGYDFLKAHGLNPWAMALSFQKLKQMEEASGGNASGGLLQLFSTHPDLDKRIENMAARATKDGYPAPSGSTPTTTPKSTSSGKWSY